MPKSGRSRRWSPWLVVVGFVGTGSVVAALGSQWGAFMRALSRLGRLSLGWLGAAVVVEIVSFVLAAELPLGEARFDPAQNERPALAVLPAELVVGNAGMAERDQRALALRLEGDRHH